MEECLAGHETTANQGRLASFDAVCSQFGGFCPQKGHAESAEKICGSRGGGQLTHDARSTKARLEAV